MKVKARVHALTAKHKTIFPQFYSQHGDVLALGLGFLLVLAMIALGRRRSGGRPRVRWFVSENGYVLRKSGSGQLQSEHRMIAEEVLERRLERWEVVHHINGRRTDNRLGNLCVMDERDHDRYHEWYAWIFNTYGNYPRRETQLRKLRGEFNGKLLIDVVRERRAG